MQGDDDEGLRALGLTDDDEADPYGIEVPERMPAPTATLRALEHMRETDPQRYAELERRGMVAALEEAETARLLRDHRPRKAERPRCGARCRSRGGAPCVASVVVDRTPDGRVRVRTRCRNHGGLSTGPTTPEGRARVAAATRKRWAAWRSNR